MRTPKAGGALSCHIVAALTAKQPLAFILENVRGLVTCHPGTFSAIMQKLRAIVEGGIMNTADHGIPQNRQRVYIVGVQKALLRPTATKLESEGLWPPARPPELLAGFLDNDTEGAKKREMAFRAAAPAGVTKKLK